MNMKKYIAFVNNCSFLSQGKKKEENTGISKCSESYRKSFQLLEEAIILELTYLFHFYPDFHSTTEVSAQKQLTRYLITFQISLF